MNKVLLNPFYYLDNFHQVLDWVSGRYNDLLLEQEFEWIARFKLLPQNSRALLVRMIMRKGLLFRSNKLVYKEIGGAYEAAQDLILGGWVQCDPLLTADDLFGILSKDDLVLVLKNCSSEHAAQLAKSKKCELLTVLQTHVTKPVRFSELFPEKEECIYRLNENFAAFCDRLKLMFFGTLYQDWTEFVLADLEIFQYEKVLIDEHTRAFSSRAEVDIYAHLHACHQRLYAGEEGESVLQDLGVAPANAWLARRYDKLLYRLAYARERAADFCEALELYRRCSHPDARLRTVRVLEKTGENAAALALAQQAQQSAHSDEETQRLLRIIPRLQRKLGLPKHPVSIEVPHQEWNLELENSSLGYSVEALVRNHVTEPDAPVYYVENSLINSLFGLLCWNAIFHPVPGAFFHPFQSGPVDLHSADFYQRRQEQFQVSLGQLETSEYKTAILARYEEKYGIQSPFIFWSALDQTLIELALECIPAAHLRCWFERILQNVKANRNGFPDLIQFWPKERRYRMIEVKGPGDRLQDNQIRLLAYARSHNMPVCVCYVKWIDVAAAAQ